MSSVRELARRFVGVHAVALRRTLTSPHPALPGPPHSVPPAAPSQPLSSITVGSMDPLRALASFAVQTALACMIAAAGQVALRNLSGQQQAEAQQQAAVQVPAQQQAPPPAPAALPAPPGPPGQPAARELLQELGEKPPSFYFGMASAHSDREH